MSDRFRELEKPLDARRLDAVLMATVASFEDLKRPTRHDLRQFTELFTPLFEAALPETKRIVSAALSRAPQVPGAVARQIAGEPVAVSAPYLANALSLTDEDIATIVASSGVEHARSLARRPGLSARSVAVLAETDDAVVLRALRLRGLLPAEETAPASGSGTAGIDRDEALRTRLKDMVSARRADRPETETTPTVPQLSAAARQRLERYARTSEPAYFATALADALATSYELVERIMLDVSGRQLAETLIAAGAGRGIAIAALEAFFPHLRGIASGDVASSRARDVVPAVAEEQARARVALWLRAAANDPDDSFAPEAHFHETAGGARGRGDAPRKAERLARRVVGAAQSRANGR